MPDRDQVLFAPLPPGKFGTIFNARELVEASGFVGKSMAFVWVKPRKDRQADLLNPERDFPFGNGYGTRANAEICLLATRGSPKRLNAAVHDVLEVPRDRHSRKPVEIYERVERLFAGPYLELFAAARAAGWRTVVSARSGETEDVTIVHLAVGWNVGAENHANSRVALQNLLYPIVS